MFKCRQCGQEFESNNGFCPRCGSSNIFDKDRGNSKYLNIDEIELDTVKEPDSTVKNKKTDKFITDVENNKQKKDKQKKEALKKAEEVKESNDIDIPMYIKDWVILLILLMIPVFNIVLMVESFTSKVMKKERRTFLKAYSIVFIGIILVVMILFLLMNAAMKSLYIV